MLRHFTCALAGLLFRVLSTQAQWTGLFMPGHDIFQQWVHCDTTRHIAFYSGANNLYDSLNLGSSTVLSLNSDEWDTIAYTFNGIPERLIYFHITLILQGPDYINADTVEGIAYLDGDNWVSYPVQPAEFFVQRFRVFDDTLYAAGSTDGLYQPFFRLVNGQWEQFGTMSGVGGINMGLDIIKWNGGY